MRNYHFDVVGKIDYFEIKVFKCVLYMYAFTVLDLVLRLNSKADMSIVTNS